MMSTYSISGCFSDQYYFMNCDENNSDNCIEKNNELILRIFNQLKSTKFLDVQKLNFKLTVDDPLNKKEISIFYRERGTNDGPNNTLPPPLKRLEKESPSTFKLELQKQFYTQLLKNEFNITTEALEDGGVQVSLDIPLSPKILGILKELNKSTPIKELYVNDPYLTNKSLDEILGSLRELEGFGNRAAHIKSREDFLKYVRRFKSPDHFCLKKAPTLRSLYLTKPMLSTINASDMEELHFYFTGLYQIITESDNIPYSDLYHFPALRTLSAPKAKEIRLSVRIKPSVLLAPNTEVVFVGDDSKLTTLSTPKLKFLFLHPTPRTLQLLNEILSLPSGCKVTIIHYDAPKGLLKQIRKIPNVRVHQGDSNKKQFESAK